MKLFKPGAFESVDWRNPEQRKQLLGCVQYFVNQNYEAEARGANGEAEALNKIVAHVQQFGADNFPAGLIPELKSYHQQPFTDSTWTELLELVDFTNTNKNSFTISDVADGLTFGEVAVGQKAKLYSMAGAQATVSFVMHGGGLGWHRTLIDDREFWNLEKNAQAFVNKWAKYRNDSAYALLNSILTGGAAAGSVTETTWQAVVPSGLAVTDANYVAIRDMETISKAAQTLITQNKDKGYGITERTPITLMFPLALRTRVLRALGVLNAGISADYRTVQFNIRPVMSETLNTTTEYIMGYPGQKNLFVDRMRLTIYDQFDPLSYSDMAVGWGRFAGAIGDFGQLTRCKTA